VGGQSDVSPPQEGPMKRSLAVLVLVAVCTGCAGPQRTLDATVLQSLQTVPVIPVAGRLMDDERRLLSKGAEANDVRTPTSSTSPSFRLGAAGIGGAMAGVALLVVFAPYYLATHYLATHKPIPEGALTREREPQSDRGRLTVALARAAAETLQERGARTAYLVDGYVRLPMADTATSPADVQFEERMQLWRWYGEKVARVDYNAMNTEGIDAILEVGVSEFEHRENALILQVQVRLVNPVTKEVLGRASHGAAHAVDPSPKTFRQLDALATDKGRESILKCLKVLGLLVE
jgi:hypothetical protein